MKARESPVDISRKKEICACRVVVYQVQPGSLPPLGQFSRRLGQRRGRGGGGGDKAQVRAAGGEDLVVAGLNRSQLRGLIVSE